MGKPKKKAMKQKQPKKKKKAVKTGVRSSQTRLKKLNPDIGLEIVQKKRTIFKLVANLKGEENIGYAMLKFRKRIFSKKMSGYLFIESYVPNIGVPRFLVTHATISFQELANLYNMPLIHKEFFLTGKANDRLANVYMENGYSQRIKGRTRALIRTYSPQKTAEK